MRTINEIHEYSRTWLGLVDPFRSPELGLIWARQAHTGGRGTPTGLEKYHPVAQDGLYYVTALLALNERIDEALRGIDCALACQDTDPQSDFYGNFRWYAEDTRVVDGNGGFFTNQVLLTIYFNYAEKLGEERCRRLLDSFRLSLPRFVKHKPRVGGTNVFVGDSTVGAILAGILGEQDAMDQLREHWEEFYHHSLTQGIGERLSPVYYGVSLTMAAMAVAYVPDARIRRIARETLDGLLQESRFFGRRTPLPARRTYNAHGEAMNMSPLAWALGINPMSAAEMERRGCLHGATLICWHSLNAAGLSPEPEPAQPEPRILEGRFGGEGEVYSFYHPDFTLGCFTNHPEPGALITSPYEMNAGFSGDGDNLGLPGLAFQFPDGSWNALPVRDELRDQGPNWRAMSESLPIEFQTVAHQHENIQIWLSNVNQLHAKLRSLGTTLRVPQFIGQALKENGEPLQGEGGRLEDGWIFLITERARFGIRCLQRSAPHLRGPQEGGPVVWHSLPADPSTVRPVPGPWHVHPDQNSIVRLADPDCRRFGLYFPCFEEESAREVKQNHVLGGIVLVAAGRSVAPQDFMARCRELRIEETWTKPSDVSRSQPCEGVRSVSVSGPDSSLRLVYDCKRNLVLERSVAGVPLPLPSPRPSVRYLGSQ